MLERLELINERYEQISEELLKPEVYNDFKKNERFKQRKNFSRINCRSL